MTEPGLGINDKKLCNFSVQVLGVDCVRLNGSGKRIQHVKARLKFDETNAEDQEIYDLPVGKIDKTHWKDIDGRCRYDPKIPEEKVERYLGDSIRAQLGNAPKRMVEKLTCVGMYKIDGKPVFCTGKAVLQDPTREIDHAFEIVPLKEKLDISDKLTEFDAAAEVFDIIGLCAEPGSILLAYKLGFFMRMAYADVGRVPKGCIYLYGKTGIQKTTFSSFLVQTYNRANGIKSPPRLNASVAAAVQILKENPGDVIVLDDLFPAESSRIRSQQEEMFSEIIRYIADGTLPAKMRGNELLHESPKCGVIFTGEYIIGKGSDAARVLPVEMKKPDVRKLRYFQENPTNLSTFYYYYISWFVEHYDEICGILMEMWTNYEDVELGVHDRLRETHFFLSSAYYIFLQYCFDKSFLAQTDAIRLHQSFNVMLTKLVKRQNERVEMGAPEQFEMVDYWRIICELYRNNQFHTADKVDDFDKNQHDSVIVKDCLYFRRECLKGFFPNENPEDIIKGLEQKGILQAGKNAKTKQISKLNGMRFYVIPLKYLT